MVSKRGRKPTPHTLRVEETRWWLSRLAYTYKLQLQREGAPTGHSKRPMSPATILLSIKDKEVPTEVYRETDEGRIQWARLEKARDDFLGEIALYLGVDPESSQDDRNRELALLLAAEVFPAVKPIGRPKRGSETKRSQPRPGTFLLKDYRRRRSGRPGMDDFTVELIASFMPTAKTLLEKERGRTVTQAEAIALIRRRLGESGVNTPSERIIRNRLALRRRIVARNPP
jgi:hypothetical protein